MDSKEDIRAFQSDGGTIPAARPRQKAKERRVMETGITVTLKEFPAYTFRVRNIQRGSILIEPEAPGKTSRMLVEEMISDL